MFDRSMKFGLGEEIDALRETVRRFAQERIAPIAADIDRENEFPAGLWAELGALGLLGITVEPEFGGSGMGYLAHVVAVEEISRASASVMPTAPTGGCENTAEATMSWSKVVGAP